MSFAFIHFFLSKQKHSQTAKNTLNFGKNIIVYAD